MNKLKRSKSSQRLTGGQAVKAALKCNKPAVIDVDVDPKALYSFRRDSLSIG